MRRGGDAIAPFVGGDVVGVEFIGVVVGTEALEDFAFLVQDADTAGKLGDADEITVEIDSAGLEDTGGINAEEITLQIEVDETVVCAVANENADRIESVIERELVRGIEIPWFSFARRRALELAVRSED